MSIHREGRLAGKRAIISGVAGGIGRVSAQLFGSEGASIIGIDRAGDAGAALERELIAGGLDFQFQTVDVASEEQIVALARRVADMWPVVDVVFNNAGIILGKPLLETTSEEWDRVQDVNAKATFLMTREIAPMMTSGRGSIINTASGGGAFALPNMAAYSAAKAAVIMFSRAAAVDLAPTIRVNAILPGVIDTPLPHSFIKDLSDQEKQAVLKDFAEGQPLGRIGKPIEVANAALFLASDESSYITGSAMMVDGGRTII